MLTTVTLDHIRERMNDGKTPKEIHKELVDILGDGIKLEQIKDAILMMKKDVKKTINKINSVIENTQIVEMDGDDYLFTMKKTSDIGDIYYEKVRIPLTLIDAIQADFSKQGANMSRKAVVDKYNLRIDVANAIKARLFIYKDSPPVSEETLKRADERGELQEKIEEVTYQASQNKYNKLVNDESQKQFERVSKKAIKTLSTIDAIIKHISHSVEHFEVTGFSDIDVRKQNAESYVIAFGDLHIGRSTEKARDSMKKMTEIAINRPESKIVLVCLGDIFEAIGATPHEGQDREMDMFGSDQFEVALDIFSSSIMHILESDKEVEFHGIAGNHDRASKMNEEDKRRVLGHIFYITMQKSLQNAHFKIQYYKDWISSFVIDNTNYIVAHGDIPKDVKRKLPNILREKGQKGMHNVFLSGHYHSAELGEMLDATRVSVPSMNIGNDYSRKQLLLDSKRGAVGIEENGYGSVNTTLYRFD